QISRNWEDQLYWWRKVMAKLCEARPEYAGIVECEASASFRRALAATAYENGDLASADHLFRRAMRTASGFLLKDRRTWLLGCAILSAHALPQGAHQRLEHLVRTTRAYRT